MSVTAASTAPVVSIQRASCTLGGRRVLDDVSLDVMRGQVGGTDRTVRGGQDDAAAVS